jgi:hypothetical protein
MYREPLLIVSTPNGLMRFNFYSNKIGQSHRYAKSIQSNCSSLAMVRVATLPIKSL